MRPARVQPDHVALEVGVRIRVGVPRGVAESVGRQRLPILPQPLPEREFHTLIVPPTAGKRRNDEVRFGKGVVAEVVEAEEQRVGMLDRPRISRGTVVTEGVERQIVVLDDVARPAPRV